MSQVHIIWDFDAAIGQINSSYPYNYHEENLYTEIKNVEKILDLARSYNFRFTFAITGFTAESGVYPFHLPDLVQAIYAGGHEIASHTWRHEWLPIIQSKQILKTLQRSKYALERCIGKEGVVKGLVLPHNRPMSWYKKLAFSFGDRGIYPFYKGADLGSILKIAGQSDYHWVRVSYRPLYEKIIGQNLNDKLRRNWTFHHNVCAIPMNYVGFDEPAIELIKIGILQNKEVVLSGHPLMLSFKNKSESEVHFVKLLQYLDSIRNQVSVLPVSESFRLKKAAIEL